MPRLNPNRAKFIKPVTIDDVVDQNSLVEYCHQTLGTPYPLAKERAALSKICNKFFEDYEDGTWRALTDVTIWAKRRNKHLNMMQLISSYRYAYEDGFMVILKNGGTNDHKTLAAMLLSVDDNRVHDKMVMATSARARDELYSEYINRTDGGADVEGSDDSEFLTGLGLTVGQAVRFRSSFAAESRHGTILGDCDGKVEVRCSGQNMLLSPHLIEIRVQGKWEWL